MQLFSEPRGLLPGMCLLPGFACDEDLERGIRQVCAEVPPRRMRVRSGKRMSVAITNCGDVGWISDAEGYRYSPDVPGTGQPWPDIPSSFFDLASRAAAAANYPGFAPDTCLINRYDVGSTMGAHQDNDEQDLSQPIVSVSLGADARFFYRLEANEPSQSVELNSGDVVVFGGPARLCFHGVRRIKPSAVAIGGAARWNLTFRVAL